jgi:hypothetical protein
VCKVGSHGISHINRWPSHSIEQKWYAILLVTGYLRVFEFAKELLVCGSKSYFGSLLCCAWRYPNIQPTRWMS